MPGVLRTWQFDKAKLNIIERNQVPIKRMDSYQIRLFQNLYFACKIIAMHYMIIEKFHKGKVKALYHRFDEKGRMLPDGVKYIDSWISEDVAVCYQLMESSTEEKLREWIGHWKDFADFEMIPVISSA